MVLVTLLLVLRAWGARRAEQAELAEMQQMQLKAKAQQLAAQRAVRVNMIQEGRESHTMLKGCTIQCTG